METNNLSNEQKTPEKGTEKVNNQAIDQEQNNSENLSVVDEKQLETNKELDNKVADDESLSAEQEETQEKDKEEVKELPKGVHYSKLSKKELLLKLNELLRHYKLEVIKDAVEEIRTNFYKKQGAEAEAAKEKFEQEGGKIEDFKFVDADEDAFKELYRQFKQKKHQASLLIEDEKKKNLQKKQKIVEEIKELINKEESINKTFQEFKNLQQKWYTIGSVPQKGIKNLWENYNHAVESFYDYVSINKELRDLDLKKNLEEKENLCQKAEKLLEEKDVLKAFKVLQDYHNLWREIGPVPRQYREPLWERFKSATSVLNKKQHTFFDELKKQQKKNLEEKRILCDQIEKIVETYTHKIKSSDKIAEKVIELQKEWKKIGYAPRKEEAKIHNRFKKACNSFFSQRRELFRETKEMYRKNFAEKMALCEKAEAAKESTDWKKTTEMIMGLREAWRKIGHVDPKVAGFVWNKFQRACDDFFEARNQYFSSSSQEQEENLKLKMALIEKVKNFEGNDNKKEVMNELKEYQKQWSQIGHVPFDKKDEIFIAFNESIEEQFKKLKIEQSEIDKINFKNRIDNWAAEKSRGKIYHERKKLIVQIREMENEIALYENNIGFFSESSNSNKMLKEVNKKIKQAKERMFAFKDKLRILDKLDF